MITKYVVYENGVELTTANSSEEANTCIECMRIQNPHKEYKIKEIQVSAVKPGFGRDPDLH
jgi:hypothetical protein